MSNNTAFNAEQFHQLLLEESGVYAAYYNISGSVSSFVWKNVPLLLDLEYAVAFKMIEMSKDILRFASYCGWVPEENAGVCIEGLTEVSNCLREAQRTWKETQDIEAVHKVIRSRDFTTHFIACGISN